MRWGQNRVIYAVAGVVLGIAIDRLLLGDSSASEGLLGGAFVAAVFAFLGPIGQELLHQQWERSRGAEERGQLHAVDLATQTLSCLSTLGYGAEPRMYEETSWPETGLRVTYGGIENWPLSRVPFWAYAESHILADESAGPALRKLKKLHGERMTLKRELDQKSLEALSSGLADGSSGPFEAYSVRAPLLDPRRQPARWFEPNNILFSARTEQRLPPLSHQDVQTVLPDGSTLTRWNVQNGSQVFVSVAVPGDADAPKMDRIYDALRTNEEFRTTLGDVRRLDTNVRLAAEEFTLKAFAFYQHVAITRRLPGHCAGCPTETRAAGRGP